jgi:hypothetical protein
MAPGSNTFAIKFLRVEVLRSANRFVQYIGVKCMSLVTSTQLVDVGFEFGSRPPVTEEQVVVNPIYKTGGGVDQSCPTSEIAVGIHGRAGIFVDSIGLICGALPPGLGAPVTKLPGPLVQAPPLAKPLSPQTKNMMIPDDMFVITRPVAGDRLSQGQLVIAATKPKVGWTNVTELELKYLDAPPNQADAYPYTTVFSVDTTTLLQGYSVAPIVTGYNGRWQVRARSAMKPTPGPWSVPVPFQMVNAQTQSPMLQAPKPNAPITQTPAPRTGMAPLMIRPRGTDEKAGKESKAAGDSPENEKKP